MSPDYEIKSHGKQITENIKIYDVDSLNSELNLDLEMKEIHYKTFGQFKDTAYCII